MKRSEFIEQLRDIAEKENYYSWYYISPEEVLGIIESLGMLPPLHTIHKDIGPLVIKNWDSKNEWEPESDSSTASDEGAKQ